MLLFLLGGHERDDVVDGGLIGLAHAEIVVGPDLLQEDEAPGRGRLQGEEPRVDLSALVGPPERLFFWSTTCIKSYGITTRYEIFSLRISCSV